MHFEALREKLLQAGIAPRRVKRYLGELHDHLAELTKRELAAGYDPEDAAIRARALLGSDDDLAKAWLNNPRLKSLTARAPWLVFGIAPPIAALLTLLPPALLLVAIGKASGLMQPHRGGPTPDWFQHLAGFTVQTGNLVLVPLIALLFVTIARRQRLSPLWPALAAGLMLFLSVRMGYQASAVGHLGSIQVSMAPFLFARTRQMLSDEWPWVGAQWLLIILPALSVMFLRRQSAN